jgi:hypothetical protein
VATWNFDLNLAELLLAKGKQWQVAGFAVGPKTYAFIEEAL